MENLESTEYILKELIYCSSINDIEEIMNFALLWNMFEGRIFGKYIKKSGIDEKTPKIAKYIKEEVIDDAFSYFKNRYVEEEEGKYKFKHLYLDRTLNKTAIETIYETLKVNSCMKEEKVKIILYIIYRLRNNLFHGEKEAYELYAQNEMFGVCNSFIIECLKHENLIRIND